MKRISLILAGLVAMLLLPVRAQDVGLLEERVKQLTGKVENMEEANASLRKQVEGLAKELAAVREHQQNQPTTPSASPDDVRELAKKVQEIEEKRKADRELILKEIKDLSKVAAGSSGSRGARSPRGDPGSGEKPPADLPKEALEHTIASGDLLSTIAAAYSKERGVKITTEMILRANPGLKAEKLLVGKKILIPIPEK